MNIATGAPQCAGPGAQGRGVRRFGAENPPACFDQEPPHAIVSCLRDPPEPALVAGAALAGDQALTLAFVQIQSYRIHGGWPPGVCPVARR
jgi:hypothetical protein